MIARCGWARGDKYIAYHDEEWGVPLHDDRALFERNRLKVNAAVTNAKAFLAVRKEFGTFDAYIWSFVEGRPVQNAWSDKVPARTGQSDAMSKDLKKRGFTFVGTTICYAFMQATGMVNDHAVTCFRHAELS
jgi:DNA-3-methyladenine glycosylase I